MACLRDLGSCKIWGRNSNRNSAIRIIKLIILLYRAWIFFFLFFDLPVESESDDIIHDLSFASARWTCFRDMTGVTVGTGTGNDNNCSDSIRWRKKKKFFKKNFPLGSLITGQLINNCTKSNKLEWNNGNETESPRVPSRPQPSNNARLNRGSVSARHLTWPDGTRQPTRARHVMSWIRSCNADVQLNSDVRIGVEFGWFLRRAASRFAYLA